MLPSPIVRSTNTSNSTASNELLTSPKEITKAEVCVTHFHEDSFCLDNRRPTQEPNNRGPRQPTCSQSAIGNMVSPNIGSVIGYSQNNI